jgi:hypothetical protein
MLSYADRVSKLACVEKPLDNTDAPDDRLRVNNDPLGTHRCIIATRVGTL